MTITLDGTNGITTPNLTNTGTETLVNLTTTGNTTLGDATTDTLTVGVTGIVKDASGNVGIGTSSPGQRLEVSNSSTNTTFSTAGNQLLVRNSGSTANAFARLDFAGSTGNPNASIAAMFENYGTGATSILFGNINTGTGSLVERMRIDTSGNLLVGTTSLVNSSNTIFRTSGANNPCLTLFKNSAANTDNAFCIGNGSGGFTNSFIVLANGNALNTNNSYGAISDVRLKENIQDATPKLADLMQVKIRQYNLVADEEKQKQLGVVADELEAVFPAMVTEDNDGFKNVKYSVFVPMLIKAIQEQQALIQSLTDRLTALESK